MADPSLPPCGLYRTLAPIGEVPEGALVYFHNHGDPGPGVYLPARWVQNRVVFHERGHTLTDLSLASQLEPLEPEGFYRVTRAFHCCDQRCREFQPELLVQLGYDAHGTPILFVPEITQAGFGIPERGTRIDRSRISLLSRLRVAVTSDQPTLH